MIFYFRSLNCFENANVDVVATATDTIRHSKGYIYICVCVVKDSTKWKISFNRRKTPKRKNHSSLSRDDAYGNNIAVVFFCFVSAKPNANVRLDVKRITLPIHTHTEV